MKLLSFYIYNPSVSKITKGFIYEELACRWCFFFVNNVSKFFFSVVFIKGILLELFFLVKQLVSMILLFSTNTFRAGMCWLENKFFSLLIKHRFSSLFVKLYLNWLLINYFLFINILSDSIFLNLWLKARNET